MPGHKIIAGAQSPTAAAMREDDDPVRVDGKPKYALKSNRPLCDPDRVFVSRCHRRPYFLAGLQGAGRLSSGGNVVWSSTAPVAASMRKKMILTQTDGMERRVMWCRLLS